MKLLLFCTLYSVDVRRKRCAEAQRDQGRVFRADAVRIINEYPKAAHTGPPRLSFAISNELRAPDDSSPSALISLPELTTLRLVHKTFRLSKPYPSYCSKGKPSHAPFETQPGLTSARRRRVSLLPLPRLLVSSPQSKRRRHHVGTARTDTVAA
jgi:hypothetical protein